VDDVFVRDRSAATTTRVSVSSAGAQANAPSGSPAISGNGGVVAFDSWASNLVGQDTNSARDVFVASLGGAATTRVSVTTAGAQASGQSSSPSISSDGSRIAFGSSAALDSEDFNGASDIYVRDRTANQTNWATEWVKTGWWATRGASSSPSISADGRYVALALDADVHIDDQNGARDIYEYELASGAWAHISRDDVHGPGNKASDAASLSADGTYTAFESSATNFNIDTNGVQDTFVHQWLGLPTADSLDSAQSAPSSTAEEPPPPRPCSLGKPALPTSEQSAQSSNTDSTGTQAGSLFLDRFRCKIRPIPRPPICLLALGCPPGVGGGDGAAKCDEKCTLEAEGAAAAEYDRVYDETYRECRQDLDLDPRVCEVLADLQATKAYRKKFKETYLRCIIRECPGEVVQPRLGGSTAANR
jgi:hypothetical protein